MNWQLVQFLRPQLFALLDLSCQGNPCLAFVLFGPRAMNRAFWFPQFTSIGNLWSCLTIDNYVKDLHGGSTWIIFNIKNKLNHIQEVTKFWVNSPSITLAWDVLLRGRLCNFINVIVLVTVGYKSRWDDASKRTKVRPRLVDHHPSDPPQTKVGGWREEAVVNKN